MIAAWMVYATLVALLLGAGALCLERALRLTGRQARWIWAVALAASLVVPLSALKPAASGPAQDVGVIVAAARVVTIPVPTPSPGLASLDTLLVAAWAAASGLVLLLLLLSQRALHRETANGERREIDGHPVCVTPAYGPAVVGGLWRATILLPVWVANLDPERRRLAVLHEANHVATGDVRLTALAALAIVACPWNPVLWWQARRLRDAIELDCDRRLVRAGVDPRAYGGLLLEVARRSSRRSLAVALAERPSLLSRRIDHMTPVPTHTRGLRAALGAALGIAFVVLACTAPGPASDADGTPTVAAAQPDQPPVRVSSPPIPYPPLLRDAGVEGKAVLEFVVDATGRVDSTSIVVISRDHPAFERPAVECIKGSVFRPAVIGGVATAMRIRQTIAWSIARPGAPVEVGADIQVTATQVTPTP